MVQEGSRKTVPVHVSSVPNRVWVGSGEKRDFFSLRWRNRQRAELSHVLPVQGLARMGQDFSRREQLCSQPAPWVELNVLVTTLGAPPLTPGLWLSQELLASLLEPWRIVTSRG